MLDPHKAYDYNKRVRRISKRGWGMLMAVVGLHLVAWVRADDATTVRDEITVKGTVLQGRVLEQATNGIRFETIYGRGELLIPYGDIELLRVDGEAQTLPVFDPSIIVNL